VERKRRRVGAAGAFVGGVLCTLSAWVMDFLPSWLGLEPGRKLMPSPRLAFLVHEINDQINIAYQKNTRPTGHRR
jgi:hypothetical protein